MNKIKIEYIFFTMAFIGICLIQVHEIQHYNDAIDFNCINISYQFIKVVAYCPMNNSNNINMLSQLRDKQFIYMWMNKDINNKIEEIKK